MSIEAQSPVIDLPWLGDIAHRSQLRWVEIANVNDPDHRYARQALKIQRSAEKVMRAVLQFDENTKTGRGGIIMTVAHRKDPYLTPKLIQVGKINAPDAEYGAKLNKYTDYALFKTHFLLQYPGMKASLENLTLPETDKWKIGENTLPGGAIAFKNGIIVGISGLSTGEKDMAAVLAIGIESHLIREPVARKLGRRFNCLQSLTQIMGVLGTD